MKRRLSSAFTTFYRITISLFLISGYVITMTTILFEDVTQKKLKIDLSDIVVLVIIHFLFLLMLYIFNRFTNVEIDDQFLYIRGIFKKDQTPFTNMECITSYFGMITVYFKKKTRFGKRISFCPYFFLPLFSYSIADELKSKIIKDPETGDANKKSMLYKTLTRY